MRRIILYIIAVFIGASVGVMALPTLWSSFHQTNNLFNQQWINGLIGAIIFLILTTIFINSLFTGLSKIDKIVSSISVQKVIFIFIGGVLGLLVGLLVGLTLGFLNIPIISNILPFLLVIIFGYLGVTIFERRGEDIVRTLFRQKKSLGKEGEDFTSTSSSQKLLDTSVIIDGRIFDIIKTGFLDGAIIVPNFVLLELQALSDSNDAMKRAKGRRGLDFINEVKEEASIVISDKDYKDIQEVDSKLLRYAVEISAALVTNDFNLNKVAEIQGVHVLNINDLANAVKQQVVVGEELPVTIIRAGSERHQGVGFMPDGTMVVVEDTDKMLDKTVMVEVTKALQTSAGRMIFAELKK